MIRETFIFRAEWLEGVREFDEHTRVTIYEAIMEYAVYGTMPQGLSPIAAYVFGTARLKIDIDKEKFREVSEARREAAKNRWSKSMQEDTNDANDANAYFAYKSMQKDANDANVCKQCKSTMSMRVSNMSVSGESESESESGCGCVSEKVSNESENGGMGEGVIGGLTPEPPTSSAADAKEKKAPLSVAAMAGEGAATPPKEQKPKASRFRPPSVEEVAAYCKERGNSVSAQSFVDFYSSKGWMVGKNAMKDWKAAVRTWEVRDRYNTSPPKTEPPKLGTEVPTEQIAARALEIYNENQRKKEIAQKEGKVWI